jgi:sialidase-1
MSRLRLLSEGILYRNPRPGYKAECAYLPNVVPISDAELVCFYRIGSAFYSSDGRIARVRSIDGGQSWTPEGVVWDPKHDSTPYSYGAPHASRMRDGSLVVIMHRRDDTDPDRPQFNAETGGLRQMDIVLTRSTDAGHTWSTPQKLELPAVDGTIDTPSQIIELNDGRWFLACEVWKGWDDAGPLHIKGFGVFSADGGKTWVDRVDFPSASDSEKMYSHSRYTRMLDGRIAALQWTQKVGTGEDFDLHFVISDESGRQWSQPKPTGIMGQTSWLADLGDGRLAATYTSRDRMQPGINVIFSPDAGHTWDMEHQVMVWDAVGQEYLGVTHKPSYPASHDNIAFGKPNTACLPNGEIISSWWCTQACVTHARFARLVVE